MGARYFRATSTLLVALGVTGSAIAAPTGPIFLSAQQFVAARFGPSTSAMQAQVREQLKATEPNAKTDVGPINWETAEFRIISFGKPVMAFRNINWTRDGFTAPPTESGAAGEAYFNCSSQASQRDFSQADVRTSESEETRTQSQSTTNRVKASVTVSYSSPAGGLGGDASLEWERTVQTSDEYTRRTRETVQSTREVRQSVQVPALTLRFFEYSTLSSRERYKVTGTAIIDVPVAAILTRPSSTRYRTLRILSKNVRVTETVPAKDFRFELGDWSYYYPDGQRSIQTEATVEITKETTLAGPTEVTFADVGQCVAARQELRNRQGDVSALIGKVRELSGHPSA